MVYDAAPGDGYLVLFGGEGPHGSLGDTWVFQNKNWTNVTPTLPNATNTPSPRYGAAMAYDAADGYVVLFGGANGSGPTLLGDTWEFLHGKWIPLCSSCTPGVTAPSARLESAASGDPGVNGVVLFGGLTDQAGSWSTLNDTWVFSGGDWAPLAPSNSPPARFGEGLAFNSTGGPLVMFGGCSQTATSTGPPVCGVPLGDSWEFLGGTWSELSTSSGSPGARIGFGFAASQSREEVLEVDGVSLSGYSNETWAMLNGSWGELTDSLLWSPSPREDVALAYDSAAGTNYFLMFGGWNGTYIGETWVYPSPFSPLRVSAPIASPEVVDVGIHRPIYLNVTISGGAGNYTKTWFGLPFGCSSVNTTRLVCHPKATAPSTTYSVVVRAQDQRGSVVWSPATLVTVNDLQPTGISAVPIEGVVPLNVTFVATPILGGTPPYTVAWVFGDGTNGTGVQVSHQYTAVGNYSANVTVTDSMGSAVPSGPVVVQVAPDLSVQLSVAPASVGIGLSATFSASVTGGIPGKNGYEFAWSGLPSSCSTADVPSISCSANAAGTYAVSVLVTDALEDKATARVAWVVTSPSTTFPTLLWGSAFAVGAFVVVMTVWIVHRRRRMSQRPSGPRESAPPPTLPP